MFTAQKIFNIFNQAQTNMINNYTTDLSPLLFNNIYQAESADGNIGKKRRSLSRDNKPKRQTLNGRQNNNNEEKKNGGILEPIIEDVKGWIARKREIYDPQPLHLFAQ